VWRANLDFIKYIPSWILAIALLGIAAAVVWVFILDHPFECSLGGFCGPLPKSPAFVAGKWNGKALEVATSGSQLNAVIATEAPQRVHIEFGDYKFKNAPVVTLGAFEGTTTYIHNLTNTFVDVIVQDIAGGRVDGALSPTKPFFFQITPTSN